MNGNTPYAGSPDVNTSVDVDLSSDEKRTLRDGVAAIATRTRRYLPDEYVVGSQVSESATGPQATVSVRPPVGRPVSAGFEPDAGDLDDGDLIDASEREEVARGLAASAALQVKQAMQDKVTPTAR